MQKQSAFRFIPKPSMLLAILAGCFVVFTLAYAIEVGNTLRYTDEGEYLRLARNLVSTGRYTLTGSAPTAYRPPAYPLFLAAGIKLGLSLTALRVANAGTLLVCMLLLYRLLFKSSVQRAGIAVLLVMSYPVLLYTAGTFYPQIPAAAFFLSAVLLLFSNAYPGTLRFLFAGALLGIAILMVPTFGFTLLFTSAFFAWRPPRLAGMRKVAVMLFGATVILSPWIARNAIVFGRFIPLSTNNGISLLTGNNDQAKSNSGVTERVVQYLGETKGLGEIEADEYYRRAALGFMRAHPRKALTLYLAKALNYYNFRNNLYVQSESSPARELIMLVTYGFLLLAAATRLCLWRRFALSELERYAFCLYVMNGLFSAVYFTRVRFRLPMDLLLIVPASAAIAIVANLLAERADKTLAAH